MAWSRKPSIPGRRWRTLAGHSGHARKARGCASALNWPLTCPPYLLGDAGKLRQVLFNLLDNAVKFTQEGGVSLRARAETMEEDPDKVMLKLEVEDSGGIPQIIWMKSLKPLAGMTTTSRQKQARDLAFQLQNHWWT